MTLPEGVTWNKRDSSGKLLTGWNGTLAERLANNSVPEPNSGCILWLGYVTEWGYAICTFNGKSAVVHRVVYELAHGKVDPKMEIDHLCRVRSCINVAHLEAVTHKENVLRGSPLAAQARKILCKRGHPFDHVRKRRNGDERVCSVCNRLRDAVNNARKRAKV